ncbi:MAG: ribonuclease III domain-containing protein [Clostridia bacterium]|nr:ribonuclease III domain-containing protein [Clostridia bacterium]MDY2714973.1 ribonuclease III domain-containing protein [Christensenellaceae bacterium]MDY3724436.1 ribonuclease III domain-containing protein [Christensenellaceae bacterium]
MKFNEILPADKVRNMNPVVLAFVGDAVYTLYVREKVVSSGDYKTGALNKMAAQTVCASAQARLAEQISTFFTEAENDVFRRARNAKKTSRAKNASVADYNASTGFEAVIGYLYLTGNYARLDELLALKD